MFKAERMDNLKARSAWGKGVNWYAWLLATTIEERSEYEGYEPKNVAELECWALNGADDWKHFSWSGCALCYDSQIAKKLCTASELKKTQNGMRRPNPREDWLDVQARALYQAFEVLKREYLAYREER